MSGFGHEPDESRKKNVLTQPGFRFGFIGALVAISVNLFFLLIYSGDTRGDWISWIIQFVVYIFISRASAEAQYRENQMRGDLEHLRGVKAAGLGAGLITSILVWLYIIIRGVVRDAYGVFIAMDPFSFACLMMVDVSVAMAMGSWGGSAVAGKYSEDRSY